MTILKLTDICKDYLQGKQTVRVLKNINLTVEQGDYLAIMGPSGSGKSTLMNIIGCLDVPTSGSYELTSAISISASCSRAFTSCPSWTRWTM